MKLSDIGLLIHTRRVALGLSQARLAVMSGLSRATINQLENGVLIDLGAAKLIAVMDIVGLSLEVGARTRPVQALAFVSQTASVSYKTTLDPVQFADALARGVLPAHMTPHVATMLDEAPLALIVAAVEEVAAKTHSAPKVLWKHLVAWAHALQSPREVWV